MAYSNFYANEPEVIWPALSWGSNEYDYDVALNNAMLNYNEGLLQAIMPLLSMEEQDPIFGSNQWSETADSEESNWFWQCKSIFAWQGGDGYLGDEITGINSEKTESSNPSEEQSESVFACQDEDAAKNYSSAYEYDIWSFCDSLLGYTGEKVSSNYGQDESGIAYEPGLREFAVYEGIFGHWPCLYGRN